MALPGQGVRLLRSVSSIETACLTFREAAISRVLITYVTAGAGHRRAAEAIAEAVTAALPETEVQCHDLLEDVPRWLQRAYPGTYYLLVRHLSLLWGTCFEFLDRRRVYALVQPIRRAWNLLVARQFIRRLKGEPPDLIIATHFFPADVVSACKEAGRLRVPLVVMVTDLHPHRFWLSPVAEAYVVSTAEGAAAAERRGVPRDRLHVLGIPIAKAFCAAFDRRALEKRFELEAGRQTILVTSGGDTVGPFEAVVEALLALEASLPRRLQLLVVCGENERAVHRLQQRARSSPMPMRVFGFIDAMPEAMAASDLIVAKAGGLTVSEAMGRGVPLILYHVIPGQEQLNAWYLARHGAAIIAPRPEDVVEAVHRFVHDPEHLGGIRRAASALSRPDAAEAIVAQVVKPLLQVRRDAFTG